MAKQEKKVLPKAASKGAVKAVATKPVPDSFGFSGALIAFFTAFIILLVRMHSYQRPMDQFFWSNGNNKIGRAHV